MSETVDFRYDPFAAEVMANPLPYYRILRDHHPLYYMPQWDTFALSRFEDVWRVLEVNDGTFVASEGTLPPTAVLAKHNTGPVGDPPLHPLPFHAVFDAELYGEIRRAHSQPLRPRPVAGLEARIRALANERLDLLLPRGSFDLTQEYGGIVAASMVCGLLGLPDDLAPQVLAAVNAGSLAEPGVGVDTAEARPNYLEFLVPVVERRRADQSGEALPVVDGLLGYRLPDGSALNDVEVATQMLCIFIGGTETVPKIVAHGLWELSKRPDQLAAVHADPATNVPLAREEMIRFCAPAQWFARTLRKSFSIHGETLKPGQRVITLLASANRIHLEPADQAVGHVRPRPALLHRLPPGQAGNRCDAAGMASQGAGLHDPKRCRHPASVQLPMGMEQDPGGGLTCGPTGSSPRTCSSGHQSQTRHPST
jgi:cytochrome P450